jgi:outer membrane protein assembly factor BamB
VRAWFLALLIVSGGCVDFGLHRNDGSGDPNGVDDGEGGVDGHAEVGDPRPEECNGEDDDQDGLVDEGFPDVDGDGVADCRDEDCTVAMPPARDVPTDDSCLGAAPPPVDDPFDLEVEWHWRAEASVVMPAIANLTDDDHDGDIDADDIPDVVFTSYSSGNVIALSGDDGTELWRSPGFRVDSGVAIGDIDGDGSPEIVAHTTDNRIRALEADGSVAWTSADTFSLLYPVPTIADLEGDGIPEVIGDVGVVSGLDGHTIAVLDLGSAGPWRAPVVADLDRDGLQEIILAGTVFDHRGERLWSTPLTRGAISAFPALVQADTDPEAEVVWAYGDELRFHEHDGTLIRAVALPGTQRPGPPCVADLDGDGDAEIAIPSSSALSAYELDGTLAWSAVINDSSGASGCVVFDMDGDQVYEVIYADMDALLILDGRSGAELYRNGAHGSVTYFETPVVADVDRDGSAEIITASSGWTGYQGITVFGHAGDGWPEAGPAWTVHDFMLTNSTPTGTVPRHPDPAWLKHNLFRGRPASDHAGLPDLAVELVDLCVASCEPGGLLRVSWQAHNRGEVVVPAGTQVELHLVDGKSRIVQGRAVVGALPVGRTSETHTFDLPWSAVPSGGSLELVIDPDDRVYECDEDNNTTAYREHFCGG